MTFDNPWLLFLLLLTIPCMLLWLASVRKREERLKKFSESSFTGKLLVGNNDSLRKWHFALFFSALFFLFLAISGPMLQGGKEKVKITGIDIMIVLDVSNSMRARDIQPDRLERAKLALGQTISKMGDDRVGLVVFAGIAYTNLPLTEDHSAAELVLESVSTDMIPVQGTAIGLAVDQAMNAFGKDEKERGKAIIVLSDGENHEDDAVDAAKRAAEKGVIVSTIGIGSTAGEKIPEYNETGNFSGNKRDMNGEEIVTKLDEQTLQNMAEAGKGMYVRATAADIGIDKIYSMLQGLSKTTKETWRYTSFIPLFRYLLALSILLFIIESLLPEGKRTTINSQKS